jgi:hypothetical protein
MSVVLSISSYTPKVAPRFMCGASSTNPVQQLNASAIAKGFTGYANASAVACWACDAATQQCTFASSDTTMSPTLALTKAACQTGCQATPPPSPPPGPPAPPVAAYMCGVSPTSPPQLLTAVAKAAKFPGYPSPDQVPCWSCSSATGECSFVANNIDATKSLALTEAACATGCQPPPPPPPSPSQEKKKKKLSTAATAGIAVAVVVAVAVVATTVGVMVAAKKKRGQP